MKLCLVLCMWFLACNHSHSWTGHCLSSHRHYLPHPHVYDHIHIVHSYTAIIYIPLHPSCLPSYPYCLQSYAPLSHCLSLYTIRPSSYSTTSEATEWVGCLHGNGHLSAISYKLTLYVLHLNWLLLFMKENTKSKCISNFTAGINKEWCMDAIFGMPSVMLSVHTSVCMSIRWDLVLEHFLVSFLYQMTPLHVAAECAHVKVLEYLVGQGANINIKDNNEVNQ